MGNIQLLDADTINKIAAGEVVERPASVVKELVENSIDAGATSVTVEIKDGGISYIRISDNGKGIEKEDIRNAFMRHATSKIRKIDDLLTVASLGFRGEALSSAASVSIIEMITNATDGGAGVRYVIEGGKESVFEETACAAGTTITVRQLFYNTPARRKFLKSPNTEGNYVNDVMAHIALSHPEISFRFISNDKIKLQTSGNMNIKDLIYQIYGRDVTSNLIECVFDHPMLKCRGYIGKPMISRGNRSFENYFINGRFIKNGVITKAIEEAFKSFLMMHKYPFCVLYFDIDPANIDVNVHPAKMEMRLNNSGVFYGIIFDSITAKLEANEIIPDISLSDIKEPQKPQIQQSFLDDLKPNNPSVKEPSVTYETVKKEKTVEAQSVVSAPIKAEVKKDANDIKEPVKETVSYPRKLNDILKERQEEEKKKLEEQKAAELAEKARIINTPEPVIKPIQEELFSSTNDKLLSEEARKDHKIIGQLFDTYWLVSFSDKLFIIDQHAAHEKVLFEKFMARYKNGEVMSQQLMPPVIISLSQGEIAMLEDNMELFNKAGFEIESFGDKEYAVRAIPVDLFGVSPKEFILEVIDSMTEDVRVKSPEAIIDRIATMSCKAAVKGNNRLSVEEADALIDQLLKAENPYNCPHGRPTIIAISKYELEKKFKRIV